MSRKRIFSFIICSVLSFAVIGQNITRPNIMGPGGVQVNSYTGSMFYQRTDLYLAGRMPIIISFSYNSDDQGKNSGYGRGWTFNYGMQVVEKNDTVTVIRNDGRKDIFVPSQGNPGFFVAPKGIFDSLRKISANYLLRSREGTKYFFNNPVHKRLTSLEDRNGNALTFTYTDSLITSVADGAGRAVQLAYTNGKLASVVDANGTPVRTYTYEYDNAGNLQKVKDPMNFTTEYGNVINGPVNIVKDKNGNVVDVVYNESFAVKEIISCLTRQTITYSQSTNTTHVTELVGSTNQLTSYKFDLSGNLIQKTGNCCGYNVKYEYDQDKNVSKLTDANGKIYTYTYDGNGNMLSETDPLGHTIHYAYEPVYNLVTDVTDKNGNHISYAYDSHGNLLQVNRPLSVTESYTYAINGDLSTITDGRGNTTSFTYDNYGSLTTVSRPLGSAIAYTYDSKGRRITMTDPLNHGTSFTYDSLDRIVSITDALSHQSFYVYDRNGNIQSFIDANNHVTVNTYDANDRLVRITNALGKSKMIGYNAKNMITSITDENGNTSTFTYDGLNRLSEKTNAAGEKTSYTYDANGNMISVVYPNGANISFTYDGINRMLHSSDAVGTIATSTYDNNGNKLTETDGNGNAVTYSYDVLNRLTSITDALGHSMVYTYDQNSNRLSYKDRNNQSVLDVYDALNRKISTTDPLNHTTSFVYDAANNLLSVTDANNHATSYSYDALNRNTVENFANTTNRTFTYDPVGNKLSRMDENGALTSYSYDAANRLTGRNYPGLNDDAYTYDDAGRLLTANNGNATISFGYDAANRKITETLNGKTTQFSYDIPGRKRTVQYPGGKLVEELYDERDHLSKVKNAAVTVAEFAYDAGSRNTSINYKNGTSTVNSFDANNRITSMLSNPGSFQNYNYGYDNEGNVLFEKKLHKPAHSEQYGHDHANRLTNFKRGTLSGNSIPAPVAQTQYNYDGVGNRNTINVNGETITYSTNNVNAYTSVSGAATAVYNHDNNGNLTSDGTISFTFDNENRLIAANNGLVAAYEYDALGRRVRKITSNSDTHFFYNGDDIIEERNGNDSLIATYILGARIDNVIAMYRNGAAYFYHYNQIGSVTSITDSLGSVVERYEYDPFGRVFFFNSTYDSIPISSIGNNVYFTGRTYDREIDKYYFRARHYDAATGKFLQKDPIGYAAGDLNLYTYVKNMPLAMLDPYGTDPQSLPEKSHNILAAINSMSPDIIEHSYGYFKKGAESLRNEAARMYQLGESRRLFYQGKVASYSRIVSMAKIGGKIIEGIEIIDASKRYFENPTSAHLFDFLTPVAIIMSPPPVKLAYGIMNIDLAIHNSLNDTRYTLGEMIFDYPEIGIKYAESRIRFLIDPVKAGADLAMKWLGSGANGGSIGNGNSILLNLVTGILFSIQTLHAVDPNEIQGPIGITVKKWMAAKDVFGFIVRYENDPEFATGPAQKVLITVPIDPSFDINSIRVGNFGFGNMIFTVPPNSPTYYTRLDLRDSLGLYVDVLAGINITDHEAIFVFESIDPATGAEPLDPNLGFLPVRDTSINRFNDSIPNKGEGFVTFSIKPKLTSQTGDTTKAQASIFFDINAPVLTNIERNTLDAFAPSSHIDSLTSSNDTITVHWSGLDDAGGVGIRDYGLYVSENGGAFTLSKKVTGHSTAFTGNPGSGYCFFILATDSVGNQEALKSSAEVCLNFLSQGVPPSIDSVAITYTPLHNVSGLPTAPYYTNYQPASGTTATIYRGDRFELSLKVSNAGNVYNLAVWVDYNNNNIFEANENVILTTRTAAVGSDWAQIPLSLGASLGKIRIRVSTDAITANDYNKLLLNGETEDYTLSFSQVLNCRWIGRVSTNWHDPANWSCGIVPDNTKSVLVPNGTPFNCEIINANVTIDRLWIQPGATINVSSGKTLNITGNNATFTW